MFKRTTIFLRWISNMPYANNERIRKEEAQNSVFKFCTGGCGTKLKPF